MRQAERSQHWFASLSGRLLTEGRASYLVPTGSAMSIELHEALYDRDPVGGELSLGLPKRIAQAALSGALQDASPDRHGF